jgi:hypothetical protein
LEANEDETEANAAKRAADAIKKLERLEHVEEAATMRAEQMEASQQC